jgi:hypothetical protein
LDCFADYESEQAAMNVHLEIPEELARQLASDATGVARAALEAIALEGVRSGKLTVSQARRLLGIESRYEMDGFLKAHGAARERGVSRSEFIRQHLALVLEQYRPHPRPRSAGIVRALKERGDEREMFGGSR